MRLKLGLIKELRFKVKAAAAETRCYSELRFHQRGAKEQTGSQAANSDLTELTGAGGCWLKPGCTIKAELMLRSLSKTGGNYTTN